MRVRADVSPLHASTSAEGKSKSFGTCGRALSLPRRGEKCRGGREREREARQGGITRRARRKIKSEREKGRGGRKPRPVQRLVSTFS